VVYPVVRRQPARVLNATSVLLNTTCDGGNYLLQSRQYQSYALSGILPYEVTKRAMN